MADIKVFCTNSAVKSQLMTRIESTIKSMPIFDNDYLEAVDTGDEISPFLFHLVVRR